MSIYKQLKFDFEFLTKYGFSFFCLEKHYIRPSVVFSDGLKKLKIGMDYEEKKMIALWGEYMHQLVGIDILKNIKLSGKTYKEQVDQVIEIVKNYIEKNYHT